MSNYDEEAGDPCQKPTWLNRIRMGAHLKDAPPSITPKGFHEQKRFVEGQISEIDTRQLEKCPNGYPRLAAFLSSENNFSLYRGFGYLHSRVLLELQEEITSLERELDLLDSVDNESDSGRKRLQNRTFDAKRPRGDDGFRPRQQVFAELRGKLVEYDELLIKARDIQAFQKPSQRDYGSVRRWFWNLKPLVEKEASFIKKKEDMITLRSEREWSSFDCLVESILLRFDCDLIRYLFCTRELREKTSDQHIYYLSGTRVEVFDGLVITGIIFALLVLPVIAMYKLTSVGNDPHNTLRAIAVLVVFTLLFSAAMSMLTKARRHELFAASAAYCAVLVVFISNFSGVN